MAFSFLHSRSAVSDFAPVPVFVLALLAAWKRPLAFHGVFATAERFGTRVAQNTRAAVLTLALLPVLLRLCLLWLIPIPVPGIHDEFSYLLASDTFAHGRLTNPTHPLWTFFESFNIIQQPTYASKYPPLQGLVMAVGQVFLGHPWWGIFLSMGILGAALYWALAGWVPSRWAVLGSFLALLQWEVFSYWMNSYWGGSLAAIGGALLLGGFPRLPASLRRRSPRVALIMALG